MKTKVCPICKIEKSVNKDFGKYFSKDRGKYRVQNYCNECQIPEKKRRSSEYYLKNKNARKKYAKDYRRDPANKSKRIKLEQKFRKQYREELQDCYVAYSIGKKAGVSAKDVRKVPGLIEAERNRLKLFRTIKKIKREKQIA